MSKPYQSFMICTAPRSGSTLLCSLLAATKMAGNPDSHFHSLSLDDWMNDYSLHHSDYASKEEALQDIFKAALKRGKGETDVFGLRMQRSSFDHFMEQLTLLLPGLMSDAKRIEKAFGPTLYVHLSRQDRLGQAISRVRAEQSGLWHRNADGSELERLAPPQQERYDAITIKSHMVTHAALDEAWEQWFEREAIEPIRISYEALAKEPKQALAKILSALHLDPTPAQTVEIPTKKLADTLSSKWRNRFENETKTKI
jgi:LPS sulfotransferase NodH